MDRNADHHQVLIISDGLFPFLTLAVRLLLAIAPTSPIPNRYQRRQAAPTK